MQEYFQRKYSYDDFISFDENYVTVNSIIESSEFFETVLPIPLNFRSEYILNILLNYFEKPFEFSEIEETEPKTFHRLTPSELRIEDFIAHAKPFLEKEQADPTYNSAAAALTRLGQDPRLFSDIEDAITSAELFGICPECDAVMHEEGCIVCQNYESWGQIMLIRKFDSIDEIHKIWSERAWFRYKTLHRLMEASNLPLDPQQEEHIFPKVPEYAIINEHVYKMKGPSDPKWEPYKFICGYLCFSIDIKEIKNIDEVNKIIKLYESNNKSNKKTKHELKIAPEYFEKVLSKEKTFEFRYNDRNYQVDDILKLKEYDNGQYTGRETSVQITYILQDFEGLQNNYAILSIKPI